MTILALDPSTKSSGWSVFHDQELFAHGCITASSTNVYNRIKKMGEEIAKLIKEHKPDGVIIEDVIPEDVKGNQVVFKALMYLQGHIMMTLNDLNSALPPNTKFYTASEWRKKCGIRTGKGIKRESLKPKDIQFVKSQFNLTVNDDEADAVCIGFAAVGGVIKEPQVIIDESGFEFG